MSTLKASNIQPPSDSDGLTFRTNQSDRVTIGADGFVRILNGTTTGVTLGGGGSVEISTSLKVANATLTPIGSAPMYACRAFASVVLITDLNSPSQDSGNIVSQDGKNLTVSQVSRGLYMFNFGTNMPTSTYSVVVSTATDAAERIIVPLIHTDGSIARIEPTASTFYVLFRGVAVTGSFNPRNFSVAVFA